MAGIVYIGENWESPSSYTTIMPKGAEMTDCKELADKLQHLAQLIEDHAPDICEEVRRVRDRVDERWWINPSATASAEITKSANKLGMDDRDFVLIMTLQSRV